MEIFNQANSKVNAMRLAAVIQSTHQYLPKRFSAYYPDLPGGVAHVPTAEKALEALKARVIHPINSRKELGSPPSKTIRK
ncbi:MAG: type II toxin-antitoxin system HicB family antitoxin, partial [Methylosarcina sp.]